MLHSAMGLQSVRLGSQAFLAGPRELRRVAGAPWRRRAARAAAFAGAGLAKQSKNVALLFVFGVGLSDVTLFNTVYVLLFGVLLIWADWAEGLWGLLVWYTAGVAVARYVYVAVTGAVGAAVATFRWSGFNDAASTWDILMYFVLLLVVVVQWEVPPAPCPAPVPVSRGEPLPPSPGRPAYAQPLTP